MIKYMLVVVATWAGDPHVNVIRDYKDIVTAEKARTAYLVVYPDTEPQNLQILQYKVNTDDIPF